MGFFSWKCAECNESVSNKHSSRIDDSDCMLVTPNETYHDPEYDGYGVFGEVDVYELLGDGDRIKGIDHYHSGDRDSLPFTIKVVHTRCCGKNYDELNESKNCSEQGFFYEDEALKYEGWL